MKSKIKKSKGWPESRRKRQAANARRQKPWLKSTGPKTAEGKAQIQKNALKHGLDSELGSNLRDVLRAHRKFLKSLETEN
jgi:hypothetical protein